MNETKGYKNISLSDLGTRQRIVQVASKVALFVPKLLGKLATKLVINPITKLTTGQTYEQVRNAAIDITMAVQKEQAAALDERIEEGYNNLEAWREDTDYYISNLGRYKSYQSTIEDLEKKQTRLLTSPKRLLVAKYYRYAMGKFIAKHKEEKAKEKLKEQVKQAYQEKLAALKEKEAEIQALKMALSESETEYNDMKKEFVQFGVDNASILEPSTTKEDYVEVATEEQVVVEPAPVQTDNVESKYEGELTEEELQNITDTVDEIAMQNVNPVVTPVTNADYTGKYLRDEAATPAANAFEPASPEEQALFAQMANMATLGQVPTSDDSTLELYGLSNEGHQKQL